MAQQSSDGAVSAAAGFTGAPVPWQRWLDFLAQESAAYRRLQQEREHGWASPALDAVYAQAKARRPGAGHTVFAGVDVGELSQRYAAHARAVLTRCAPDLFAPAPGAGRVAKRGRHDGGAGDAVAARPPTFLDLGCAPGGVSRFLALDLGWRGVGVSLAVADGGIAMDPRLAGGDPPAPAAYRFIAGSVLRPHDWLPRAAAFFAPPPPLPPPPRGDPSAAAARPALLRPAPAFRVNFVNGGAVQDHGQRGDTTTTSAGATEPPHGTAGKGEGDGGGDRRGDWGDRGGVADGEAVAVGSPWGAGGCLAGDFCPLPWFHFLVPQLFTALDCVADGGSVMLVAGMPTCGSLFLLLHYLRPFWGDDNDDGDGDGGGDAAAARRPVTFLPTMHVTKSPVYVLLRGLRVAGRSEAEAHAARRHALQQLCDALRRGRDFWLLAGEPEWRAAQAAFRRHRRSLEAVWEASAAALERKRRRAEQRP